MNFKSLIVVGLGIATLGLSLPAHADTANDVNIKQEAIVTGHGNVTGQSESTSIRNRGNWFSSGVVALVRSLPKIKLLMLLVKGT